MAAIAPMEPVTNDLSIPLKCNLCPRKPTFSDVSHLLTHVSSKSHLAHKFNIELRTLAEPKAVAMLDEYERWYHNYNIQGLLHDRLIAKGGKGKANRRGRVPAGASHSRNRASRIEHDEDEVDDAEDDDDDSFPSEIKSEPIENLDAAPPIPPWHTAQSRMDDHGILDMTHAQHQLRPLYMTHTHGHRQGHPADSPTFQTHFLPAARLHFSPASGSPDFHSSTLYRRWSSETATTESVVPSEVPAEAFSQAGEDPDLAKLKGQIFPGMGLFDSASEDQKKKRNQRKDDSVIKAMEITSNGIKPEEYVWADSGELQRTRDIYATPSVEGTPERELADPEPPKKRRTRRTTAAAPSIKSPVRTRNLRSSARIAKMTLRKRIRNGCAPSSSPIDEEVISNTSSRASTRSQASTDSYDVFHDRSVVAPGRTGSPMDTSKQHTFEGPRRPALTPMPSNLSIHSPGHVHMKHPHQGFGHGPMKPPQQSFFPRDLAPAQGAGQFSPQLHGLQGHYHVFHPPQGGIVQGNFANSNPLYMQTRGGMSLHHFSTSSTSFPPVNGLGYNHYATYNPQGPHERGHTSFDH